MIKVAVTLIVSFVGMILMIKKNSVVTLNQETTSVQKKEL